MAKKKNTLARRHCLRNLKNISQARRNQMRASASSGRLVSGCLSKVTAADLQEFRNNQLGKFGAASECKSIELSPEEKAAILARQGD